MSTLARTVLLVGVGWGVFPKALAFVDQDGPDKQRPVHQRDPTESNSDTERSEKKLLERRTVVSQRAYLKEEVIGGAIVHVVAGGKHVKVNITIYDGSDVQLTGNGRWIIMVPRGCSQDVLDALVNKIPFGAFSTYVGHAQGGLCLFVMEGTLEQVRQDLDGFQFPLKPIVETDVMFNALSEVKQTTEAEEEEEKEMAKGGSSNIPWGLDRIDERSGRDGRFSETRTGAGVHAYVLDTGIRTTHADFEGRAVTTLDVPINMRECTGNRYCALDKNGHGTHCAATIGGRRYGVAKQVMLHAVKVLRDDGGGYTSWTVEAIDWVLANAQRPALISASLLGQRSVEAIKEAVNTAVNDGVTVVVAAANQGTQQLCNFRFVGVTSAVTVGSTTKDDDRSSFSNFGECVDIFAPGSSIVSAGVTSDDAETTLSGTSMACSHVSGVVALFLGPQGLASGPLPPPPLPALYSIDQGSHMTAKEVRNHLLSIASRSKIGNIGSGVPNRFIYTGARILPRFPQAHAMAHAMSPATN